MAVSADFLTGSKFILQLLSVIRGVQVQEHVRFGGKICRYHVVLPVPGIDLATAIVQVGQQVGQVGSIFYMSHLACADEADNPCSSSQQQRFSDATEGLCGERSLANSAGILVWPECHFDWVRPGIMLYGSSPLPGSTARALDLRPVMTLESRLIAVNTLRQGDAIGYGSDWVCPEPMRVGVAAMGYGDGFPRVRNQGDILIHGQRVPIVGGNAMDAITRGTLDGLRLLANIGRGFRPPNIFDLGTLGSRPGNRFNVPNPDLDPEALAAREVQITDLDRHYYESHALTLARHPAETDARMMVRLLSIERHTRNQNDCVTLTCISAKIIQMATYLFIDHVVGLEVQISTNNTMQQHNKIRAFQRCFIDYS